MSGFVITGGRSLCGDINIQGAKNSVLPLLAATILCRGESVIHNCPRLRDVDNSVKILEYLGCAVKRDGNSIAVDTSGMNRYEIPDHLMREMRSSVIFLGAVLARAGNVRMSMPGGCELGPRPIDLHIAALHDLGAEVREEGGNIFCRSGGMEGREINLSFPSVGATENIMLAATAAKGVTRIINAAREPEIEDLQAFLQKIGARINGAGSSVIEIEGGHECTPAEHTVIPDRIAVATYLCAAATAGGELRLKNACPAHVSTVSTVLAEAGCEVRTGTGEIIIKKTKPLVSVRPVRTMPYPGFPTDAQAILMAVLASAAGTTLFIENIFENRYRHVNELLRMGADIKVFSRTAVVCGVPRLTSADVSSTDLRGGAALVIAALGVDGTSTVRETEHILRGYEDMDNHLRDVGADISRI